MDTEDPSSASCRIVVVSSSLETSREVATHIKALSGDSGEPGDQAVSEVIPWTIKNKYYTAPVHFHPIHLEGLESIELDDVPAIIYAWKENEPYKAHLKQVAEHTCSYEPEVSLAINMAPSTDEELEDFFFGHGFEYIDGHTQVPDRSAGLYDSTAPPGFHRALDALSTIMWPSMVRAEPTQSKAANAQAQSAGVEVDLDLKALIDASTPAEKSAIQHEMEMLEKWLEEDTDDNYGYSSIADDNDDYLSLSSHTHSFVVPRSDDPWSTGASLADSDAATTAGFDDDFAEFVSAPPPVSASADSDSAGHTSTSEPGVDTNADSDPELPSKADIRAASARIFGSSAPPGTHQDDPTAPQLRSAREQGEGGASAVADPDADAGLPVFDLTRVLGALEGMKAEIARIPDIRERRAAAAKAALGLVYGLEGTAGELDFTVEPGEREEAR
ncbi:hypothetical protein M0805_005922 [Coniferiporia weirii]|nr:hypothetical protein M0805_005922 [Coniferiporia weirii]